MLHWSHSIATGAAFTDKNGVITTNGDDAGGGGRSDDGNGDDSVDEIVIIGRRKASGRATARTKERVKLDCIYLLVGATMNNSLTALQRQQFRRYGRQLYRMLLRVSADPHALPTVEARTFLRVHTREQFRRHSPLVQSQADAQALLERAHTVLLAIADEASKRSPPRQHE